MIRRLAAAAFEDACRLVGEVVGALVFASLRKRGG